MSGRKWMFMVICALLCVFLTWALLNVLVDPFGTFGSELFRWDSYVQTLNPRNSKVVYIKEHFDQYDSYIIGSSSAASYLPETLDSYLDSKFYNMFHYGADIGYDKELVSFLLKNDNVKHIFLVLGINEANNPGGKASSITEQTHYSVSGQSRIAYYGQFLFASPHYAFEKISSAVSDTILPQAFDVFLPESGTYDKCVRDVESIGSMEAYSEKNGADFYHYGKNGSLAAIDHCADSVRQIRTMCEEAGAELTVVLSPVYSAQLESYSTETLNEYFTKIAAVTDYWNFAVTPLSYDARFFYDATHTRNATADMVLARIFQNSEKYIPDSFGVLCKGGATVNAENLMEAAKNTPTQTDVVPILLYHHFAEDDLLPETFRHHVELLKQNGYQTISFEQMIDFVEKGTPLPENSVVITFDDGYQSNYDYAFPILKENNFSATIFVIGCSVGHKQFYKDTSYELTPHFGQEEIDEMVSSGLVTIASHTYDMHQWAPFESNTDVRESIMPLEGESEAEYISLLTEDVRLQSQLFDSLGLEPSRVLAFPLGSHCTLADVILKNCGIKVTVTTDRTRVNTIVSGLPQSLIDLGRMSVAQTTTDDAILQYVSAGRENRE